MSQRAFTARLIVSDEDRAALWETHCVFNERLRWVLRQMHRMKRGEPDPRYAEIFQTMKTVNDASARLESVTSLGWKGGKADRWCELARELIGEGKLLFDRQRELAGLLHHRFHRRLFEAAFQIIHGHRELVANWEKEHGEWKDARVKWEQENPEYMRIRPILEAFEAEHGQAAKRRLRWHKWLAFLRGRPDLAAWRGAPAVVNEPNAAAKHRVEKARRNKRNKIESDEFFKVNPELKALSDRHGDYQREFIRPWARRRNPDGFRHRPTFTEPSADKHPFWFQFMKSQGYKDLDLKECSVSLWLLGSDASKPTWKCREFKFRPDRRLRLIRKSPEAVKSGKRAICLCVR